MNGLTKLEGDYHLDRGLEPKKAARLKLNLLAHIIAVNLGQESIPYGIQFSEIEDDNWQWYSEDPSMPMTYSNIELRESVENDALMSYQAVRMAELIEKYAKSSAWGYDISTDGDFIIIRQNKSESNTASNQLKDTLGANLQERGSSVVLDSKAELQELFLGDIKVGLPKEVGATGSVEKL